MGNKALGRGLEQLFNSESLDFNEFENNIVNEAREDEIIRVKLTDLRSNPYQPRKVFDEKALNELASSIKEHGVFQPIIIKKSIKGYDIIAGERRVKASKIAGEETIPAVVRDFTDDEMMQIALLENLQRENLNSIEEAHAYKNILEKMELTQEQLSKKLGKSRSHITNMIGLLRLPEEIQTLIMNKKISMGHARVLSKLEEKAKIRELADLILEEGLSVRELEKLATSQDVKKKNEIKRRKPKDNEYKYVEEDLTEVLGTKVKIRGSKIEITFTSVNDLNRLIDIIK